MAAMLLGLPQELLLRVTDFIEVLPYPDIKATLKALSLTCRALSPFARVKLLRRIYVSSGARANAMITEIQLWNNVQRRVVRELRVDRLGPTSGKANQKVSHDVLADLLVLLPYLEFLEADRFAGVSISDRLATALSRLDLLRTVIISSGSTNAPASGIFALLSSLSPRASFDVIRINVPGQPKPLKGALPSLSIKFRVLCITQGNFGVAGSLSREAMWPGFAACLGTSIAYLDILIAWVHEDILRAVAPTIRALCIRSDARCDDLDERVLRSDISLPRLECLHLSLETVSKISNLRVPIFSNARILVISRSRNRNPPSALLGVVWDNIVRAKFEVLCIAVYRDAVNSDHPVQVHMFPWRRTAWNFLGDIEVVECESAYPDLLALLDRRECVRTKGLW